MRTGRIASIQTTHERGGAEYANVDLLAALQARGHDVVLITDLPAIADATGIRVRPVELGPKLGRATVRPILRATPRILFRLIGALRAEQPVAVTLLHFKKEQLLCALLPRRLTGRIVWAEWGPVPEQMRDGGPGLLYRLAARRATRILAVSEGTRESIIATGVAPERVEVVANLMDAERLSFDAAARERLRAEWSVGGETLVVGCLSRFQRRKRIDVAIDAVAHLPDDVLLVVAGEGETESELRRRAEPYADRIRFMSSPRGSVQEFLSACDVLVFTPGPTEGAPRVISEAQLVGVPVVATASSGTEGLIAPGGGAVVSPPNDPVATAEMLAAYGADPTRRQREAVEARSAARARHEPERLLSQVEALMGLGS